MTDLYIEDKGIKMKQKHLIIIAILVFCVLFFTFTSCSRIDSGEVGIVTTFGKPSEEILNPGLHFLNPFSSVTTIDLKIRTVVAESEAASSDLQRVHTAITLNYKVDYANAVKLFTKVSKDEKYIESAIVTPFVNESFKAVVAHFTAENLVNKRDEVSREIQDLLNSKLNKTYLDAISISVTNFKFSDSFNAAIEGKVTAQQEILTTQNKLLKQRVDNEIAITKAQTESQAIVLRAEADAKALNLKKMALTPELIQLNAIEKWNGVLPVYSSNSLPFIKEIK
jgi:regulator of protease activity HflC (stomatin/prohibitin superfamily)